MSDGPRSLIHAVFSTDTSRPTIPGYLIESLWSFCGVLARRHEMKALAVGGSENHLHILLSVPNTLDLASALHLIKNGSAEFLNEHLDGTFSWQEGYGAFTVQLPAGNDNSLKGLFLAKNGVVLDARCCLKMNS